MEEGMGSACVRERGGTYMTRAFEPKPAAHRARGDLVIDVLYETHIFGKK
jgi:hypothetical protein